MEAKLTSVEAAKPVVSFEADTDDGERRKRAPAEEFQANLSSKLDGKVSGGDRTRQILKLFKNKSLIAIADFLVVIHQLGFPASNDEDAKAAFNLLDNTNSGQVPITKLIQFVSSADYDKTSKIDEFMTGYGAKGRAEESAASAVTALAGDALPSWWSEDDIIAQLQKKIVEHTSKSNDRFRQAFKLFANKATGITVADFKRGCLRIGLPISTEQSKSLVKRFDTDGNGVIDLNEFIDGIMPKEYDTSEENGTWLTLGGSPRSPPASEATASGTKLTPPISPAAPDVSIWSLKELTNAIRDKLESHTSKGSDRFRQAFKLFDSKSQGISLEAFAATIRRHLMLNLSEKQASELFAKFDLDGNGLIDLSEFISGFTAKDYSSKSYFERSEEQTLKKKEASKMELKKEYESIYSTETAIDESITGTVATSSAGKPLLSKHTIPVKRRDAIEKATNAIWIKIEQYTSKGSDLYRQAFVLFNRKENWNIETFIKQISKWGIFLRDDQAGDLFALCGPSRDHLVLGDLVRYIMPSDYEGATLVDKSEDDRSKAPPKEHALKELPSHLEKWRWSQNEILSRWRDKVHQRSAKHTEQLHVTFNRLDRNGDGKIDKTEFKSGMFDYGFILTDNEVNSIFKSFDKNSDDLLDLREFDRALTASGDGDVTMKRTAKYAIDDVDFVSDASMKASFSAAAEHAKEDTKKTITLKAPTASSRPNSKNASLGDLIVKSRKSLDIVLRGLPEREFVSFSELQTAMSVAAGLTIPNDVEDSFVKRYAEGGTASNLSTIAIMKELMESEADMTYSDAIESPEKVSTSKVGKTSGKESGNTMKDATTELATTTRVKKPTRPEDTYWKALLDKLGEPVATGVPPKLTPRIARAVVLESFKDSPVLSSHKAKQRTLMNEMSRNKLTPLVTTSLSSSPSTKLITSPIKNQSGVPIGKSASDRLYAQLKVPLVPLSSPVAGTKSPRTKALMMKDAMIMSSSPTHAGKESIFEGKVTVPRVAVTAINDVKGSVGRHAIKFAPGIF